MKTLFSIVVIIAVTIMLAIFVPGRANASASLEEFETYTNEDYGFSIDYPSNWLAKEVDLQPNQIVLFHPDPDKFDDELPSPATVSELPPPGISF